MDDTITPEQKLQNCIINSWKFVTNELKNYSVIVKKAEDHVSLLVSHETTLKNIEPFNEENTEIYRIHPDSKLKLQACIEREIHSEETAIAQLVKDLNKSFSSIITQIDKIFNVYRSNAVDVSKGCENFFSLAQMLEAVDKFQRFFSDDHMGRKYTLEAFLLTGNVEKLIDLWNMSEVTSLQLEVNSIIPTECSSTAS